MGCPKFVICQFYNRDIPDCLNGSDNLTPLAVKRACLPHQDLLLSLWPGEICFGNQDIFLAGDP